VGGELDQVGRLLHERLIAGDELATAEIAELFMRPLVGKLTSLFPTVRDHHLISTAVEDAMLSYFARPAQFDPSKLNLFKYLRMAARSDLLNSLRRPRIVELTAPASEHVLENIRDPADLDDAMMLDDSPLLREVNGLLTSPVDREFFALMADGERKTAEYARVLGISDRPAGEQATVVKRHKDRLKKSLQRKLKRPVDGDE
jgi:hypothetical protein